MHMTKFQRQLRQPVRVTAHKQKELTRILEYQEVEWMDILIYGIDMPEDEAHNGAENNYE